MMAYDLGVIGAGVKLDNKPFLSSINQMQNRTSSVLSDMQGAFLRIFGTLGVIKLFKDTTTASMDFGQALSNVVSIADDLEIDEVRKEITGLNSVLGKSTELTNSFYRAYSAGARGSAEELANFTGETAKLGRAIRADQIATMKAVTKLMNSYGLAVSDAAEINDTLFQIVKQGDTTGQEIATTIGLVANSASVAGVSLDEMGAALAVLTRTMETSRAVVSLNQVITSFLDPTKEAKGVAKELGIELSATAIKNKGFAASIAEINEKAGDNVEALNLMFGNIRAFRAIASLAGTQSETFQKILVEFGEKGGSALKAFAVQTDNAKTTWTTSMADMNKAMIQFGDAIAPMVEGLSVIITGISDTVSGMDGWEIKLGLGAVALSLITNKLRAFAFTTRESTMANALNTTSVNANTAALMRNASASALAKQSITRSAVKTGVFKNQINALGGSMGVLSAAMIAVPVAMASWKFGKWISGITGMDDKLVKFYGNLLNGREEIVQQGFILDEALLGARRGVFNKRLDDMQKQLPEFTEEFDEFRKKLSQIDPDDLQGLTQIEKKFREFKKDISTPLELEIADIVQMKHLKGTLAETLLNFTKEEAEIFRAKFQDENIDFITKDQIKGFIEQSQQLTAAFSLQEATDNFEHNLIEIKNMAAKFEQDRLDIRLTAGGEQAQRESLLEQLEVEQAFFQTQLKSLYNEQQIFKAAGLEKETEKVTEELQKQLEKYDENKEDIIDLQKEIADNSPLGKLREEMQKAGGIQKLRDSLFKDGVTQQEKNVLLKTAGPAGAERFAELLTIARDRGLEGKQAEEVALSTLNEELRTQLKQGNITDEQQLTLLERIAEAVESGKGAILFAG